MKVILIVAFVVCFMCSVAHCELPKPCWMVRMFVDAKGLPAAIAWARANGWTEAQINEAKRTCLR
jgi:hypothetical protein